MYILVADDFLRQTVSRGRLDLLIVVFDQFNVLVAMLFVEFDRIVVSSLYMKFKIGHLFISGSMILKLLQERSSNTTRAIDRQDTDRHDVQINLSVLVLQFSTSDSSY